MAEKKIVLLGAGGVGKSAFTIQFIQGKFISYYDPTIEDSYQKLIFLGDIGYAVEIIDTAGTVNIFFDIYIACYPDLTSIHRASSSICQTIASDKAKDSFLFTVSSRKRRSRP